MTDFELCLDWFYSCLSSVFNTMTSHWLLGIFLLICVFSLLINLVLIIRGKQ